jgi:cytochrome c biogenesis factor
MNLVQNQDYFNIRYQVKPFMIWIWLSVLLISFGGLKSFLKKNMKIKIFTNFFTLFFFIIFFIFYKGLQNSNIYIPKIILKKIFHLLK